MKVVDGALKKGVAEGLPGLCVAALAGSPWSALLIAIHVKPKDFAELMRVIGVPRTLGAGFDAAADGYSMYVDALDQGAEL